MNFSDLRYLSFEVAPACNLQVAHAFCPVNDPLRYPLHEGRVPCPDATVASFAKKVHDRGFKGLVGFHYYCDPLMNVDRMLSLMDRIRKEVPEARYILWTNGTLLQPVHRNWLEAFEKVVITMHDRSAEERIKGITNGLPNVQLADPYYDARLDIYSASGRVVGPCIRPAKIELPVNYFGWVRLCCADYRGWVSLGNIDQEDHDKVLDGFSETADMVAAGNVPLCWKCRALPSSPVAVV